MVPRIIAVVFVVIASVAGSTAGVGAGGVALLTMAVQERRIDDNAQRIEEIDQFKTELRQKLASIEEKLSILVQHYVEGDDG